jgi:hypothetical protein
MQTCFRKLLSVGFVLGISAAAHAQSPTALQQGRTSIAFTLPNSGGEDIGLWKFTNDRTNVGLDLGFGYASIHDAGSTASAHQWHLNAGPAIKKYFNATTHVAPFGRFGVSGGYFHAPSEHHVTVGAQAGLGADWFPTDQISIGGYTGLQANLNRVQQSGRTRNNWDAGTFLSALTLHIYF